MIISLSGFAGSGKDTVGSMIQYLSIHDPFMTFENFLANPTKSDWEIKRWADKLKQISSIITGIPMEKFEDQEFKKTNLGHEWNYIKRVYGEHYDGFVEDWEDVDTPMTVREFLQKIGTEAMRNGLHTNTWVNALMAEYKPTRVQWSNGPLGGYEDGPLPNWIITDTRFMNEVKVINEKRGFLVRVVRAGVGPINNHPSEIEIADYAGYDYILHNNGSFKDLQRDVEFMMGYLSYTNPVSIYNV